MKLTELAFFTKDVGTMARFYRHLLGSEPVVEADGLAIFMVGETKILLHHTYTPSPKELPPTNHIAFTVANVDETCQQLVAAGLTLEVAPTDYDWGRSAYLRDPDGQQIELTQG